MTPVAFRAHGTRHLRRLGAEGDPVTVAIDATALTLSGDSGPALRVPVDAITRLRAGFSEEKWGPFYVAEITRSDGPPIRLYPLREDGALYRHAIRQLAADLAARRGLAAVQRGTSLGNALVTPVLTAIPLLVGLYFSIVALAGEGTLIRWLPVLLPGLIFLFFAWRFQTRHRPRPVASLDELDRQLPAA